MLLIKIKVLVPTGERKSKIMEGYQMRKIIQGIIVFTAVFVLMKFIFNWDWKYTIDGIVFMSAGYIAGIITSKIT